MAKVYVSSTIADLTEERRAVLDWLRLARHQAVDSYLPDSDTVRDSCLNDVGACDLYVLIVGHRYGFQPSEDNPDGLSITQLEFRRAGECGIPRVALLRTSIPDVRLSDLQDPARAQLVLTFRDEVASQVRPAEFSDLKGLIQGLSTGIQGELARLDQGDKRREAQLKAEERGREAMSPGAIRRLVDEAVFVSAVADWPGNLSTPRYVAEQLRSHLAPTALVLIDEDHAERSLRDAETALVEFEALDDPTWKQPFAAVRGQLRTLLENLPPWEAYLERLADVAGPDRVDVIRSGYYRTQQTEGDRYAFIYLLLLCDLGEREPLLGILKERLLQIRDSQEHPFERPVETRKAFQATCRLAIQVLDDSFEAWWRQNLDDDPPRRP